ncbi:hypothetical protein LOTGIDRAFT_161819 [Lottia gigantea]|uniref:Uncharacterized protein n=1 Tax=Lottia gigantea TaxID=225164 RepID=V4A917_LOTGI|nr:hypothetical protein LOTGIDRAFT_161819 [Lottia gigantea]ESO93257.1 hypothetical protein LOTGIDRAFT_161819 [Lottia gigantea]
MSRIDNDNSTVNTTSTHLTSSQPTEEDDLSLLLSYISIGISGLTLILITILIFIICSRRKKKNVRAYKPHLTGSYVLKTRRHYDTEYNSENSGLDNSIDGINSHQNISRKQTNDFKRTEGKPEMREKQDLDYANEEMMANNRHTIYNDRDLEILNNDFYVCSGLYH